jgi:hypothetical protein
VNLAAVVQSVEGDSASIEVQLYDQYERWLGASTPSTEQMLLQTCQERLGYDTGSGGGAYAINADVAAYTTNSLDEAQALLTDLDLGVASDRFIGALTMTSNIIEDCEVRRVLNQESVIEIARSAFESFTMKLSIDSTRDTYVVFRVLNNMGTASPWTSTEVLVILAK